MTELSVWAYPWSFSPDPQRDMDRLRELGVTHVSLAVTYHAATILRPVPGPDMLRVLPDGQVHVPVDPGRFPPGQAPTPSPWADRVGDLASAARKAGLSLKAWVVALHDLSLPGGRVVNADGAVLPHAHCPLDPDTGHWLEGLLHSVAALGAFEAAELEAMEFLPLLHGAHHEIYPHTPSAVESLLLQRCFCPHCLARAAREGVDGQAAQEEARAVLASWRRGNLTGEDPFEYAELAGLLQARPHLVAYLAAQAAGIRETLARLRHAAQGGGMRLGVVLGTSRRPGALSFMSGIPLSPSLLQAVDDVVLCAYHATAERVRRDLAASLSLLQAPPSRMILGLSLLPVRMPDPEEAERAAAAGASLGVRRLSVYHYELLPSDRLALLPSLRARLAG